MTVSILDAYTIPNFPSSSTLKKQSPSQQQIILERISSTLSHALTLPDDKLAKSKYADFISSYARDGRAQILNALVFTDSDTITLVDTSKGKLIRKQVLNLALRLAGLPRAGGLTIHILLDLCVTYGSRNRSKITELLEKAVGSDSTLLQDIEMFVMPSFASTLLSPESGLHALRKASFCLASLLQCTPASVRRVFANNTDFVVALAQCYQERLTAIAAGYGGIDVDRSDADESAAMWVACKASLVDCFHVCLQQVLKDVAQEPLQNTERAFGLVFKLLQLPSTSTQNQNSTEQRPFLNRPLIADYQETYALSATLAAVLANEDDPRLDVLEATLNSFEERTNRGDRAGALKILLRSSGAPPAVDYRGNGSAKGKAPAVRSDDVATSDHGAAVAGVLDVLPDQDPEYVRNLLSLPQYSGNAERVIAALLEGDAPPSESVTPGFGESTPKPISERRNIFDEQPVQAITINVGKRQTTADAALRDRSFMDQMKADILRRAAELSESEAGTESEDDSADALGRVKVADGGEESLEEDVPEEELPQTPEAMCELAYIKDSKVFDRDAETRRSKARAELKAHTGWSDEQLEGWRIMFERNPKKDKILQKHEAPSVNQKGLDFNSRPATPDAAGSSRGEGRGRGQGRGRGGRGRGGRGRGGGSGGGDGGDTRQRAWKDKHKASQANHNRKRGHDKKMARGGGLPGPSQ